MLIGDDGIPPLKYGLRAYQGQRSRPVLKPRRASLKGLPTRTQQALA